MKPVIFIKNAVILTVTSLLLRTVGIFFRIWLAGRVGPEGIGLYQLIFSVYMMAAIFATTGVSTAVTRLVTEELATGSRANILRVLRRAILLSVLFAVVSAAAVFLGADAIAVGWIGDARAAAALRILCFSLPCMGVSSCLRGYFIARRKTGPQSGAQLFEQLVRIVLVLLLIGKYAHLGLGYACAAVLLGDTAAEAASCLLMYVLWRRDCRRLETGGGASRRGIVKTMLSIALPISGGRFISTSLHTAENLLVPACLNRFAGSRETSLGQFGMLKGMAIPILFFPSSFLSALSMLMIPEITEALARGKAFSVKASVERTFQITLSVSILIGGIFLCTAPALGQVIYQSEQVGFLIRALAPIVPFMYLESVVDGILKGMDQQLHSFWYSVADSSLRIAAILLSVPRAGMLAFLGIMTVSNILTSSLNARRLLKVAGVKMEWSKWVIKPVFAAASGAALAFYLCKPLCGAFDLLFTIFCALVTAAVYFVLLWLTGALDLRDLHALRRSRRAA